ncbi:MAG: hypothetical protein BGO14_07790 [Chlamydiales bacterium 38-26]|nr:hypothetical protein [Chlamydiales bacterium]OJV10899.1 MAG: hypothetical protein BGO14_07790 [Chlamydiales bacterium 38-26]
MTISPLKTIPFNQSFDLIYRLNYIKHQPLLDVNRKFGGLCELICNRVLIDDLLGKGQEENFLKERISLEKMSEKRITKSHLLNIYSVMRKVVAYLFKIYPDNIFSCFNQWKLIKPNPLHPRKIGVNRSLLEKGFKNIKVGETLKLQVFSRKGFNLTGHALLIKKTTPANYIFFDPNTGEHRDLCLSKISDCMDDQLNQWRATDIFLTRGQGYLQRLVKKLGPEVLNKP